METVALKFEPRVQEYLQIEDYHHGQQRERDPQQVLEHFGDAYHRALRGGGVMSIWHADQFRGSCYEGMLIRAIQQLTGFGGGGP